MSSLSRGSLQLSSQVLRPTWWPAAQGPPSLSECEPLHKLPHLLSSVCPWGPESKFWRAEINTHLRLPTMSIRLMISIHLHTEIHIHPRLPTISIHLLYTKRSAYNPPATQLLCSGSQCAVCTSSASEHHTCSPKALACHWSFLVLVITTKLQGESYLPEDSGPLGPLACSTTILDPSSDRPCCSCTASSASLRI